MNTTLTVTAKQVVIALGLIILVALAYLIGHHNVSNGNYGGYYHHYHSYSSYHHYKSHYSYNN